MILVLWVVKETGVSCYILYVHVAESILHTSRFAFMMDSVPLAC